MGFSWRLQISDTTVGNILREHGIEPVPDRKRQSTWREFLEAHRDVLGAIDFTTIEVWTRSGLVTFYLLFVMEVATRRVHLAGCTTSPDERWMKQVARNLTDSVDGFLEGKRYVLMDRDTKFSAAFRAVLKDAGVKAVRLPPRSPNLNSHLEQFLRSLKEECLDRMIFFGERSLRRATTEYLAHYHGERNHQGLDNRLIAGGEEIGHASGPVSGTARRDAAVLLQGGRVGPLAAEIIGQDPNISLYNCVPERQPTPRVGSNLPALGQESAPLIRRSRDPEGLQGSFDYFAHTGSFEYFHPTGCSMTSC